MLLWEQGQACLICLTTWFQLRECSLLLLLCLLRSQPLCLYSDSNTHSNARSHLMGFHHAHLLSAFHPEMASGGTGHFNLSSWADLDQKTLAWGTKLPKDDGTVFPTRGTCLAYPKVSPCCLSHAAVAYVVVSQLAVSHHVVS